MDSRRLKDTKTETFSSPDQMNEYIRVATPRAWLLLTGIMLITVGICVWGIFGKMETKINAAVVVEDGSIIGFIEEEYSSSVKVGARIVLNENEYEITSLSAIPQEVDSAFPSYLMYVGALEEGDWVRAITAEPLGAAETDGTYNAEIILDSVSPVYFLWN